MSIHKTAIIENGAKIGNDVEIGAFTIIGSNVSIGDGTIVGNHTVIDGLMQQQLGQQGQFVRNQVGLFGGKI